MCAVQENPPKNYQRLRIFHENIDEVPAIKISTAIPERKGQKHTRSNQNKYEDWYD